MPPLPLRPDLAPEPQALRPPPFVDYELLDSGGGRKLERYGPVTVVRPEPQCLWTPTLPEGRWEAADAVFDPDGEEDAGRWRTRGRIPDAWPLAYGGVSFKARLSPFRHLGFFPEQAANWRFIEEGLQAAPGAAFLNLFGYTGVASLVAAHAGARVTHVDASRKSVGFARENAALSHLEAAPVRWICEDARRYVQRELRRGSRYDAVILDPPKYGRGPGGEVWRLHEDLPQMVRDCAALLSPDARFLILNAYAERISGLALAHLLRETLAGRGGRIEFGELTLAETRPEGRAIGVSFFARWSRS